MASLAIPSPTSSISVSFSNRDRGSRLAFDSFLLIQTRTCSVSRIINGLLLKKTGHFLSRLGILSFLGGKQF